MHTRPMAGNSCVDGTATKMHVLLSEETMVCGGLVMVRACLPGDVSGSWRWNISGILEQNARCPGSYLATISVHGRVRGFASYLGAQFPRQVN